MNIPVLTVPEYEEAESDVNAWRKKLHTFLSFYEPTMNRCGSCNKCK